MNAPTFHVSKHALQRMRQRFHLLVPSIYLTSDNALRDYVTRIAVKGKEEADWQRSHFYRNKMHSKYGMDVVIIKAGSIYLLGHHVPNGVIITTCTRKPPYL